jgi:hypothetical protein
MNVKQLSATLLGDSTTGAISVNYKHRKISHSLFAHPISGNISLKQVESVFQELGAEIEERQHSKIAVKLNAHTVAFHHAKHDLPKQEVQQIKKFIVDCGIDPTRDYPL